MDDRGIDCRKIHLGPQTLPEWVMKAEVYSGKRAGVPPEVANEVKALEREVRELRKANEGQRNASAYSRRRGSTGRSGDDRFHCRSPRFLWGKPICRALPIAPSTYCEHVTHRQDPGASIGAGAAGCGVLAQDSLRVRRQLRGLWRTQCLPADDPRGLCGLALHGGAADA